MWTVIDSPIGALRLVAHGDELTAIQFEPFDEAPDPDGGQSLGERVDTDPVLVETARQLAAYFAGERTDFDLPLAPVGTAFQQRVWHAIAEIPCGQVLTYGQVAKRIQSGPRAVGQACGANWYPLVIPCHRVTAAGGLGQQAARRRDGLRRE